VARQPWPALVSFGRVLAHRPPPPDADTRVRPHGTQVDSWTVDADLLQRYRDVLDSRADLPLAFPALLVTRLLRDLVGAGGLPVRGMGLVHVGTTLWTAGRLDPAQPWQVTAWVDGGRHTRSGLEIDLAGRCSAGGATWSLRMPVLARSRRAAGAEPSAVPDLPEPTDAWHEEALLEVPAGVGLAYARVSGDWNPIHLHAATARPLGFRTAIAHGWWSVPRTLAVLGLDETPPTGGRRLDVAYARPVPLPSRMRLLRRTNGHTAFLIQSRDGKTAVGGTLATT
jgi:acyl dehydratase